MKKRLLSLSFLLILCLTLAGSGGLARETHPPDEPLVVPVGREGGLWEMKVLTPGKPGGEAKYSTDRFPQTFNDLLAESGATKDVTAMIMGAGLTAENPINGRIVPGFAKSWEISEDGRVYTFHLRKGLRFSDGHPMTAEDVLFTYEELIYNPEVKTEVRAALRVDDRLPEIEKVDSHTVRFNLPEPSGPFLRRMSTGIYPTHKFETTEGEEFNKAWGLETASREPEEIVGAGPFQLRKFIPGKKIVMKRNPYYYKVDPHGTQLPYLDSYQVFKVKNDDVEFLKFTNEETDFLRAQIQDMPYLLSHRDEEGWTVFTGRGDRGAPLNADFLTFNWDTGDKELSNLFRQSAFRRAVSLVIDRARMVEEVFNSFGQLQYGPISRLSAYHNSEMEALLPTKQDQEKAEATLDELGIEDGDGDGTREFESGEGVKFTITVNQENEVRTRSAEIIAQNLSQIGIEVETRQVNFKNFSSRLIEGKFEAAIVRVLTDPLEPSTLSDIFKSDGSLHLWHPKADRAPVDWESEIDRLFEKGSSAQKFERRKRYYDRFQEIYARELPLIYLPGESFLYGTSGSLKNTGGFSRLGTFLDFAEYIWMNPE